jgi:hypothetical protein
LPRRALNRRGAGAVGVTCGARGVCARVLQGRAVAPFTARRPRSLGGRRRSAAWLSKGPLAGVRDLEFWFARVGKRGSQIVDI